MQQQTGTTVFIPPPRVVAAMRRALWLHPMAILSIPLLVWAYRLLRGIGLSADDWYIWLVFLGVSCLVWFPTWALYRHTRGHRLIVDDRGCHYDHQPGHWIIRTMPSWSFRWEQQRHPVITITPSHTRAGLQFVELHFDLAVGSHEPLVAGEWVPAHAPQEVCWRFEDTVEASSLELVALLLRLPLLQHLVQQRDCVLQIAPAALRRMPFYLGRNRYSLTVVGLLALFCLYSIADDILVHSGLWHETYVAGPLWNVIGAASLEWGGATLHVLTARQDSLGPQPVRLPGGSGGLWNGARARLAPAQSPHR